ncbi:SDR family NAD(P)-dependent oxidoreductase [Lacinutrix neustonica]|uniref:SDR family NAD(P)-dependent oxidoreductase n=1 Tax=Lacinutrix neustonica TaxID=2980107 RepID=A0A9E8SE30_9FLAO|nr:SDR family NAD(P)-dependent oxidoreductase [Lacinutrix neustonica]WAC03093.1 SDR family NAD(P)-dependent oxidoreductase [Lacinutrix neustonica]
MNFKDKVVVITGAGSGIGAATAKLFGTHKAHVVVSDINLENAEKVAIEIRDAGGKASALATDVTQFEQVEELLQTVIKKQGRLGRHG